MTECGARDFSNNTMVNAALSVNIEYLKFCKDLAMDRAACGGYMDLAQLCKEWGATNFNSVMDSAAEGGHMDLVKLCKEWGATSF